VIVLETIVKDVHVKVIRLILEGKIIICEQRRTSNYLIS